MYAQAAMFSLYQLLLAAYMGFEDPLPPAFASPALASLGLLFGHFWGVAGGVGER